VALAEADSKAALWAVTCTEFDGTLAGAVYKPEEETIPTVEFPPRTPFTIQFTAVLFVADTEAVNCCDCPTWRLEERGDILTEMLWPRWPFPFPAKAVGKQKIR
jgi:hypothetical protein